MGDGIKVQKGTPILGTSLYNLGDECTALTGGWVKNSISGGTVLFTKNTDNLYLSATSTSAYVATETSSLIDTTKFNTLYFEIENTGTASSENRVFLAVGSTKNANCTSQVGQNGTVALTVTYQNYTKSIFSINVSAISGSYYVRVGVYGIYSSNSILKIYRAWGE